jgi:hypothetical protein
MEDKELRHVHQDGGEVLVKIVGERFEFLCPACKVRHEGPAKWYEKRMSIRIGRLEKPIKYGVSEAKYQCHSYIEGDVIYFFEDSLSAPGQKMKLR